MALSISAPSALGHGHFLGADSRGPHRGWETGEGRRAALETRFSLRFRSRHRQTRLAHTGKTGGGWKRSGRMVCADAAYSFETAGLQPQWRRYRRLDRFHSRHARACERDSLEISSRASFMYAHVVQDRWLL